MSEQDGKIVNLGGLKKFKEYYDTDIITPINNKIDSKTNVQSGEIITTNNDTTGYFKDIKITGNTRYKKSDGTYTDTWESGVSLESMGEKEKNSNGKYPIEIVSCGKNLFSTELFEKISLNENCNLCSWNEDTGVLHLSWNGIKTYLTLLTSQKIKKNTQYTLSFEIQGKQSWLPNTIRIEYTDGTESQSQTTLDSTTEYKKIILISDVNKTISRIYWIGVNISNVRNLQLEEGTIATNYEPYKEDKRTVLLDSPLRKNDVLDLEKLKITRNYGSATFNGSDSENWELGVNHTNSIVFYKGLSGSRKYTQSTPSSLLCDKFIYNWNVWSSEEEGVRIEEYGALQISILKSKLETQDVLGFKKWLQSNPVTVVYQLATPTTEDIDVSSNTLTDFATGCTLTIDNTIKGNIECNEVVGLIPSVEEDRTRLTNLETDNTTNKSNITNLQKSLENKAEKAHNHTIADVTNLQTTLDSKAPEKYNLQFEGAISSNFREKIAGTKNECGFVKSFRKNDTTDACMPQYSSGIAWGQADTHGMLCVNYNNQTAYVAGGNQNKLNWSKQLAWKDDLTSYSLKTHTHNYAGSSSAGGSATSAITSDFTGVTWTTTTQVGTWSALCKFTNYSSGIFSLIVDQNSQCGFDTFIVSTGWDSARIYQLGGNGYTDNSGYQLRLVKESDTQYTLEIKNDYGYNGAKTLDVQCRYIVTCNRTGTNLSLIKYTTFCPSSGKPEKVKITTSPSGNILTDSINFSNLDSGTRGIGGTIGGSDYWRLVGGASTADEGFVELATADNGTEPITVSQYTGKFETLTRRMYLLDSNGNTIIPGHLELENMKQILGKDTSGAYINLITMDKYNRINMGDPKKCNSVLLASKSANIVAYDGSQHYTVYHSGNFNPSNYLSKSGGTMTGNITLPKGKTINTTTSGGNTLLEETDSNVNIGFATKGVNLNCSAGYVNGSMILTKGNSNYAEVLFMGTTGGTTRKNVSSCMKITTSSDKYYPVFTAPSDGVYLFMAWGSVSNAVLAVNQQELCSNNQQSGVKPIYLSKSDEASFYIWFSGNANSGLSSGIDIVVMKIN